MRILSVFAVLHAVAEADLLGVMDYSPREFSPQHMFGTLARRQEAGACDAGFHSCLDVQNPAVSCCPNDQYCYLAPGGLVNCCPIGSNCKNQCATATSLSSAVAIPQTITISGNATTTWSCSARSCAAGSQFLCPSSLGGQCCGFSSSCASGGQCISTINSLTAAPPAATFTGCATGQFSCPALEGGGCCNNGAKCTASDATLLCVATVTTGSGSISPTAIRTGPSGSIDSNFTEVVTKASSSTLSSGAKAGIGIGVALGVIIIAAGILLFALSRRRAHRRYLAESTVGGHTRSEDSHGEKRLTPRSRNEKDYFGPTAKVGPYTETASTLGMTPLGSPDSTNRGVPASPQGPADIAAPVEIGGSLPIELPRRLVSDIPEKPEFRIELP